MTLSVLDMPESATVTPLYPLYEGDFDPRVDTDAFTPLMSDDDEDDDFDDEEDDEYDDGYPDDQYPNDDPDADPADDEDWPE